MGIIRLGFAYLKQKYLEIFPTQTVDEGDPNTQFIHFCSGVADDAQQNQLKIEGFNNPYAMTGDLLVKTFLKLGWIPLRGYSARVKIAVNTSTENYVGETFKLTAYDQDFEATCTSQTDGGTVLFLDLETTKPCEFLFLQDIVVTYDGDLEVEGITNILLSFSGRNPEGEIEFRNRVLAEAITPNAFRLAQSYENTFLEPMPSVITGQNGTYSLVYPRNSNITLDKLLFLYIGFNDRVPVKSDATEEFQEFELDFKNNVKVTFGVNLYGEVSLRIIVYVQPGTNQQTRDKVIGLLKNYSYTPTPNSPIYGKNIIASLEDVGITAVLGISFIYNGLTQIALTSQDYKDFILDEENPIIIQEGNG